jgi:hypothetical protein
MVGRDRMRFFATTNETAGRYSFFAVDVPVGSGPSPHVHQEADEWFYVQQGNPVVHVDDPHVHPRRGRLRAHSHGHHTLVRGTRCAGQGARRILPSRRGARLLVGRGRRRNQQTQAGRERCVRKPEARLPDILEAEPPGRSVRWRAGEPDDQTGIASRICTSEGVSMTRSRRSHGGFRVVLPPSPGHREPDLPLCRQTAWINAGAPDPETYPA